MSRLYVFLGKQIAHFRRRANLTQEQLAEKTGYSVDFIGLVERGINAPTVERLGQMADVLGVEIWRLFKPTNGLGKTADTSRRNASKTKRRSDPKR